MRKKHGIPFFFGLCAMLCLTACAPGEKKNDPPRPIKIADYLYELTLEDYLFTPLPETDPDCFPLGCSTVRKGNLFGRNLDLYYCEIPEFVIRIPAAEGRFASIGVCADPEAVCDVMEMSEETLLSMPNITNDGINENGVVISVNVVDATGVDELSGTAPGKEKIHAGRIVRYLLDRAESASHAVELMKEKDIVGGFEGCGLHWMIADEKDTFVVEIIGGKLTVSRNEPAIMTNFYLNIGEITPVQSIGGNLFRNLPLLNDYAIGVERWCILRDGYAGVSSVTDMIELMKKVRATATYDKGNDPVWYSEFVGNGLSIHADKADLEKKFAQEAALFEQRDRKDPKGDWITWHSSVYDIENRTLFLWSQEDYANRFVYHLGK